MANLIRTGSLTLLVIAASIACNRAPERILTFSGSVVGREGEIIRLQLERFQRDHPSLSVALRATPDSADQRHQLYVQWLNARASDPDVLQLDVVWTAEFAAAGWISSLDRFHPDTGAFFDSTIAASRWRDALYALPWFTDVGMLYLAHRPPAARAS